MRVRWHTGPVTDVTLELEVAWQSHVGADRRLLDGILARHREKHRRYHTADHVAWVIRHVVELAATEPVEHLDEVVAAAFYHDAVYEPTYPANERASARLARRDLSGAGWADDAVERVAGMIEATEHVARDTDLPDDAIDRAVLLDADLAILGADPAGYSTYVAGIRSEYRHLDDDEWRTGRADVLRAFLDRPTIYATDSGRARWERRSRANLAAELADLSA
jgi:predicted metal-dependent HD superfamily phosphohydrolase